MNELKKNKPTKEFVEKVRSIYDYNPDTGVFTFKVRRTAKMPGDIAGAMNKSGYIQISIDNVLYYAHRLAWVYMTGDWPVALVDHIDRNRSNNCWQNLRVVSPSGNARNMSLMSRSSSGQIGVTFDKKSGKWYSKITVEYRQMSLGFYSNFEDAVAARKSAEQLYGFGEYMESFKAEHMSGEVVDWEINCVEEEK